MMKRRMRMKINKDKKNQVKEIEVLLTFLKLTKEGRYATIEESSLPYSRIEEQPEGFCEDQYIYGMI
jgi:hypothetical protein